MKLWPRVFSYKKICLNSMSARFLQYIVEGFDRHLGFAYVRGYLFLCRFGSLP